MADTVFQKGDVDSVDYTPTADIANGQVIVIGNVPHICVLPQFLFNAALPGRRIGISRRGGVYLVAAAGAIGAGVRVWWDNTAKQVTLVEAGNKSFGITVTASTTAGDLISVEHAPTASVGSVAYAVAAAGSVQGDGGQLQVGLNVVTGADATKGVKLPAATASFAPIVVTNSSASALKVWPATGGYINVAAINTALSMAANTAATFHAAADGLTWWTSPRVPS